MQTMKVYTSRHSDKRSWLQRRFTETIIQGCYHIGLAIPYEYFQPGEAFKRLAFRAQRHYWYLQALKAAK